MRKILFVVVLMVFVLSACGAHETPLPIPTASPTATPTLMPSPTPTPTPTPTPILPVQLGTQLPDTSSTLNLQNIADIRELARYSGNANTIIRVSNDNLFLVTGSTGGIDIYDLSHNSLIQHINTYIPNLWDDEYNIYNMGISENADLILVVNNENVEIYSREGDIVYQYPLQFDICSEEIKSMWAYMPELRGAKAALSPDGKLLAVNICDTFKVINIINDQIVYTWDNKYPSLHGAPLAFSPDSSLLAVEFENYLWIWSVDGWENIAKYYLGFELSDPSLGLAWTFSPDTALIAIAFEDGVRIWNIEENDLVQEFPVERRPQVKFSDDSSKIGMAYWGGLIDVWDLESKMLISENQTQVQDISQIQITAEGEVIVHSIPDRNLSLWGGYRYLNSFEFLEEQQSFYIQANSLSVSGDHSCVVSPSANTQCWKQTSVYGVNERQQYFWNGEKLYYTEIHGATVNLFDGDNNILSFMIGGNWGFTPHYFDTVHNILFYSVNETPNVSKSYIRDVEKNRVIKEWTGYIYRVVISPDKRFAAFFISHNPKDELVIFDLTEKQVLFHETFSWAPGWKSALSFSPDSQRLVYSAVTLDDSPTAQNENIYPIYIMEINSPDNRSRYELKTDGYGIYALEYSADGSFIAASHSNGIISILDVRNGEIVYEWPAHPATITSLSFSSDGKLLASSAESGFISIWGIWP